MQQLSNFFTKVIAAKKKHNLPLFSLVLYYLMAFAMQHRHIRLSIAIGEYLQRKFGANFAVSSALAYAYRQSNNFVGECKALMRVVKDHHHDSEYLFRASESAAFSADLESLARLLDLTLQNNVAMHLYIKGLIAFVRGQPNYAIHFQEAVRSYLDPQGVETPDASENSVSLLLKKANASGRPLPEFIRGASNIRELCIIDRLLDIKESTHKPPFIETELNKSTITAPAFINPIVLISCSLGYLQVFGEYYISTVRRKNKNIIHFHVLDDDLEVCRNFMENLRRMHANVSYSLERLDGNAHTYITLSRFLICRDLMRHYKSDVLVSDIDLCVDYDLSSLGISLRANKTDFGLFSLRYCVPWGKFAIGFSYFRVNNYASEMYLNVFSRYATWLYTNGGYFSLDMVAGMIAYEYMRERDCKFALQDLSEFADIMTMHTRIPKKLQKGKIEVKFANGIPE